MELAKTKVNKQEFCDAVTQKMLELVNRNNFIEYYDIDSGCNAKTIDKAVTIYPWARNLHLMHWFSILGRRDMPERYPEYSPSAWQHVSSTNDIYGQGHLTFCASAAKLTVVVTPSHDLYNDFYDRMHLLFAKQCEMKKNGFKIVENPQMNAALRNLEKSCFTIPQSMYALRLLDTMLMHVK